MKKTFLILLISNLLIACSVLYKADYTTKPVFCYQLSPKDMQPGKNCIGSGGHGG